MKAISELRTDVGRVRKLNEDSVYIERDERLLSERGELLVVADGMGGHQSGEVASQQAIESIKKAYYNEPFNHPGKMLKQAIEQANRAIFARAQTENRMGMGTTVVAAARLNDLLYIAHVGDSRLYLIRTGKIYPMTEDHSLVAEQVAAGILTPQQAKHHPYRNIISRAVGTSPDVDVELATRPRKLKDGDIAILCSDGLTEHLSDQDILQIVQGRTPAAASDALIEAANKAGGRDNISVIVTLVGTSDTLKNITNQQSVVVDDETEPLIYQNLFRGSSSDHKQNISGSRSVLFLAGLLAVWMMMFLGVTGGWVLWQRELLVFTPNAPNFSITDSIAQPNNASSALNESKTRPTTISDIATDSTLPSAPPSLATSTRSLSPMTTEITFFIPILAVTTVEREGLPSSSSSASRQFTVPSYATSAFSASILPHPQAPQPINANQISEKSTTVRFTWEWNGHPLKPKEKFAIFIQQPDQPAKLAATSVEQQIEINMQEISNDFEADWYWIVVVINEQQAEVSPRSDQAKFNIILTQKQ